MSGEESFTMPILGTRFSITWKPTAGDRETAHQNHDQSLERLKERGGVDWTELDAIVANEPYHERKRDEDSSRKRVHLILMQRNVGVVRPESVVKNPPGP